jgi:quercetin dioxygenase-like cupin family protein
MHHAILKPGLAAAVTAAVALGLAAPLVASEASEAHHTVALPDEIEWGEGPDFIEPGAELVVLSGDPGEGPFTARLRLPEGYEIHAHTHPEPKHLTVIEGAVHIGYGEELNRDDAIRVPAGGYIEVPADHIHYEWFEEDTVLQVQMTGPIVVTYVDPERDPRN